MSATTASPHLQAVLATESASPTKTPSDKQELLDLVLMVADSAWKAKDWEACKRAYRLSVNMAESTGADRRADRALALSRLGRIELMAGNAALAGERFSDSMAWRRDSATSVNLAIVFTKLKIYDRAAGLCQEALAIDPTFIPAYIQQAAIYQETGDYQTAEATVLKALAIAPENSELLYALSLYQLRRGDFENGWLNYEFRQPRLDLCAKLDEYPEWQGGDLIGKTILVCGEQGMGDQIMWARYLDYLIRRAAKVVLFTRPELARLMSISRAGGIAVLTSDAELKGLEPDYWVAMGSLPRLAQHGGGQYYMCPQSDDVERFRSLMGEQWPRNRPILTGTRAERVSRETLRIGLCWRGNPQYRYDEYRSMAWAAMKPLLDIPGTAFYSLQYGDRESGLLNLTEYCHDWADTAAAISNLDLVISVDTGIAHLAGSLGKPVWILLGEKCVDWRWGTDGTASWYPSAVLYREPKKAIEAIWWNGFRAVYQAGVVNLSYTASGGTQPYWFGGEYAALEASRPADATVSGLGAFPANDITPNACRVEFPLAGADQNIGSLKPKISDTPIVDESAAAGYGAGFAHGPIVTGPTRYGQMSWYRNDHYIGRALECYGEYSESEVDLFRRILKPGDVVVEVGANIGALTVALAEIVGPSGSVVAFEPQELYFQLAENVARLIQAIPRDWALGSETKKIALRDIETEKIHAPGWPASGVERHLMQQHLNDIRIDPDLIKIDVDGEELAILKGAEATIARCRPLIYVEFDKPDRYPDMPQWLIAHGYRLYQHSASLFNPDNFAGNKVNVFGSIVSLMILAVPNERKDLHPGDWGLQRIRMEKE